MAQRRYTRQAANKLLPEVRKQLERLQTAYGDMQELSRRLKRVSESNGSRRPVAEFDRAAATVEDLLGWFGERGIIVRDIPQGLIDFPALRDGEEVLLCWKAPEPAVDFWHYPDAGFAGRRPL